MFSRIARRRSSSCSQLGRHLLQLLDARAIVLPVDGDRFDLLIEDLEDGSKVRPKRPRANRARAALAKLDDLLALPLNVLQLVEQRLRVWSRLPADRAPNPCAVPRIRCCVCSSSARAHSRAATTSGSSVGARLDLRQALAGLHDLPRERGRASRAASCGGSSSLHPRSSSCNSIWSADSGANSAVRRSSCSFACAVSASSRPMRSSSRCSERALAVGYPQLGDERLHRFPLALDRLPPRRNIFERTTRGVAPRRGRLGARYGFDSREPSPRLMQPGRRRDRSCRRAVRSPRQ